MGSPAADNYSQWVEERAQEGHDISIVTAESTADLEDLARRLGCQLEQLHKTVILNYVSNKVRHLVAVIVPATARVDTEKVAGALGVIPAKKMKSAQKEVITEGTGFVPGGIPPVGFEVTRLLQEGVTRHDQIFAGGGNNLNSYTRLNPQSILNLYPDTRVGDFVE